MFTGIIEKTAPVLVHEITDATGGTPALGSRLRLETGFKDLVLGESVAVNGACLTVAELPTGAQPGEAVFFLSAETLARTQLGAIRSGDSVNLERALLATSRLSGHIVQGHVDGVGELTAMTPVGESRRLDFNIPSDLLRYCVEKGSIAIQGVSLTLNQVTRDGVSVMIIPHTWEHTNLGDLKAGSPVNIEADILAKHVAKLMSPLERN